MSGVPLTEAAKLSEDDLQRGVLETFVQESPVLDRIPFLTIQGNAYAYNEEKALPGVEFRAVNGSYSESTGTVNPKSEKLTILGGDADVDTFVAQTLGNLNDQRAIQTNMKVKAASYKFQDGFINGDETTEANAFDGLKKRLTGEQVLNSGNTALAIHDPADDSVAHNFFDQLEELMAAVNGGPTVLYANRSVLAKIKSAGRRIGGYEMVVNDITGKREVMWNGVPILDLGNGPDGDPVLPQAEASADGVAYTNASSIYAVKFGNNEGDQAVTGLTNGGVQVKDLGELDVKPAYRTRLEFFCGLAVFGGKGAARLQGVVTAPAA